MESWGRPNLQRQKIRKGREEHFLSFKSERGEIENEWVCVRKRKKETKKERTKERERERERERESVCVCVYVMCVK